MSALAAGTGAVKIVRKAANDPPPSGALMVVSAIRARVDHQVGQVAKHAPVPVPALVVNPDVDCELVEAARRAPAPAPAPR